MDENGKPNRWRVENSWGKEPGKDGYYLMTDRWFDEYMYQVVVNKKYLTAEQVACWSIISPGSGSRRRPRTPGSRRFPSALS